MTCATRSEVDFASYLVDPGATEWNGFRAHYPGCPDCSRELLRWTELEEALRDVTSSTPHPTDEILLAFRRAPDSLEAAQRDEVSAHLAECAPCRDAVGAVVSLDLERLLADSAASGAVPAAAESLIDRIRGLFELPAPVWAAVAAAALLLALGIPWLMGEDSEPGSSLAQQEAREEREEPVVPETPSEPLPEETFAQRTPEPEIAPEASPEAVPDPVPVPPTPAERVAVAEENPPAPTPAPKSPSAPVAATPRPTLVTSLGYSPVVFKERMGLPKGRIAVATRAAGAPATPPLVLAPERVGLTLSSVPTLFWFLAERRTAGVRLDINDLDAMKSVVSKRLKGPFAVGIHALRLADHGVRLSTGHNYQWTLTVDGADAPSSGGIVRREAPDASLKAALGSATPAERVRILARNGIWHDALDLLSRSIQSRPQDAELRNGRAQLLEQAGFDAAAALDRRGR